MGKVEAKKAQAIERITEYMILHGLSDMGLRKLAAVAGTSDRMLIYYFGTKGGLIGTVLQVIASNFAAQLDALLGEHKRPFDQLLAELLQLGESQQFKLTLCLWFELVGLAVRGQEPYASNTKAIAETWITWIESRLENPQAGDAAAMLAKIEGTFMLQLIGIEGV